MEIGNGGGGGEGGGAGDEAAVGVNKNGFPFLPGLACSRCWGVSVPRIGLFHQHRVGGSNGKTFSRFAGLACS